MKRWKAAVCIFFTLIPSLGSAEEKLQPRVLIGLYDSQWEASPRPGPIHRFLVMPANHLGFDVQFHDINEPLPELGNDVAGIIAWFNEGMEVQNIIPYLTWIDDGLKHGKKFIFIGNPGIGEKGRKNPEVMVLWNDVLDHMGMHDENSWHDITYKARIAQIDKDMVGFEHKIGPFLPPFNGIHAGADATSHLRIALQDGRKDDGFDMIVTSPHGGYIAQGYAMFTIPGKDGADLTQWYVNPFLFMKAALGGDLTPAPDYTTLDGRRIFYSHIDGDGWNNVSEIPKYRKKVMISAEVFEQEVFKPYSDFPFTVALISADVDPDCFAVRDSERVAREIFALPNVEPSSHTYTHPLFWRFFEHYKPAQEAPFSSLYPPKPGRDLSIVDILKQNLFVGESGGSSDPHYKSHASNIPDIPMKLGKNDPTVKEELEKYYSTPRSYYCSDFNIEHEIVDSIKVAQKMAPPEKKVKLIQWSGDTSPFEAALRLTREKGFLNLNGGSSRFDDEHPSYSFIAPIGLKVGAERQIYATSSNEETYTDLWTNRFFGYRYLKVTAQNTEIPLRISPFNIYFHMFSGEKEASVNAIKENLDFARTQQLHPIIASHYSSIVNGFYSTAITSIGDKAWRITNRGDMNTMRFDNATNFSVNFASSKGILGQRYFQNNLYVFLDPAAKEPAIYLKPNEEPYELPVEKIPYLVESSWDVNTIERNTQKLTFNIQGFGAGTMRWNMPQAGEYIVEATGKSKNAAPLFAKHIRVSDDHLLTVTFDKTSGIEPLLVTIRPASLKQG
jgi:hypothetical protein